MISGCTINISIDARNELYIQFIQLFEDQWYCLKSGYGSISIILIVQPLKEQHVPSK
jgi:hypothetical protein